MDNEEKIIKLNQENEKLRMELQTMKERMEIYNSEPNTNSGISIGYFIQNKQDDIHPNRQRRTSTQYNVRRTTCKFGSKPTPQQKKEYFWRFFCCKKRTNRVG